MRWLIGLLILCHALAGQAQSDPFPHIAAAYWLEVNGAPVWHRRAQERVAPASLTKMMTALLVLEHANTAAALQTTVQVSAAAARETGTRIALRAGETWSLDNLLAATLVASANDACHALAAHIAGDQARFVQRMNHRAAALGLHNTHFVNACGHDAPGHYASAQDLALLAHALMLQPRALELSALAELRIESADHSRSVLLKSTNALLGRSPGVVGLKTGRTPQAGNCLVALAQRDGTQVLLVLLKGKDRWWDAADLLDLAFARANQAR